MQIRSDRGWVKAGLAVLVTGVLGGGVLAAACGTGPEKVTADGKTAAAEGDPTAPLEGPSKEPKPDPEVGEKIEVGSDGGSVAVLAVEDDVNAGRLLSPGKGNKYIAVEVKGCAGPNERNLTFEPAYFLLRLDDGTVHDPGPGVKKPSLEGGTMEPGKCLSGWVTYTVKEGGYATAVIYDGSSRLTWRVPLPKDAKPTTTTTVRAGASTTTAEAGGDSDETDDSDDRDRSGRSGTSDRTERTTATTAKSKTTSSTGKPTATTARSTTATTAKSSKGSSKGSSSKTEPDDPAPKSSSKGSSTATTGKASATGGKSSTTETTEKSSGSTPTTSGGASKSSSGSESGTRSASTTSTTGKTAAGDADAGSGSDSGSTTKPTTADGD